MKAALFPDRTVIKVIGDDARKFLHGLVTVDILSLTPGTARFCALLTPQGKIIADFFVAEAPSADGGGWMLAEHCFKVDEALIRICGDAVCNLVCERVERNAAFA